MPTKEQVEELFYGCSLISAPGGTIVVSKSNKRLFLPATGYYYASENWEVPFFGVKNEDEGYYWTGSRDSYETSEGVEYNYPSIFLGSYPKPCYGEKQFFGLPIRSVDRVAHPDTGW